jgi:cyclopropane-fatty-acyl-phospholipid synthase
MIEAVGHNYFPTFMGALDRLLAPDGVIVIQAITMPEPRYAEYIRSADFINTVRSKAVRVPMAGRVMAPPAGPSTAK